MLYALIMAGGRGTRFWPASRTRTPKQLLPLFGGTTVLNHTIDRMDGLVDPASILIATNTAQASAVRKCAPTIPDENIIVVSHGGAIAHLIARLMGTRPAFGHQYIMHNSAVTELAFREGSQKPELSTLNFHDHLPEDLKVEPTRRAGKLSK